MPQLNIFENGSVMNRLEMNSFNEARNLQFIYAFIPGSISFNNVAALLQATVTTSNTYSVQFDFGLYSYNGGTLSLANSASFSHSMSSSQATFISWMTMVTSATQNITPGDWWFGIRYGLGNPNNNNYGLAVMGNLPGIAAPPAGIMTHGFSSTSTAALPASVATSGLSKMGNGGNSSGQIEQWYILIAA